MELIYWVIIGYAIVLTCSLAFLLYMFKVANPKASARLGKKFLFDVFTSKDPEDQKLVKAMGSGISKTLTDMFTSKDKDDIERVNAMGYALADRAIGLVVGMGEAAAKGNTAPIQSLVSPLIDAVHYKIESAANGAIGHAKREAMKDYNVEYNLIRESLPKSSQKYADAGYGLLRLWQMRAGRDKSNSPGGRGASTTATQYVKV